MTKEQREELNEFRKTHPELFEKNDEDKSLGWRITDSDWYDWNSSARFLLTQIHVLGMKSEDSNYPNDAPPEYKADKIGWCWLSQARLGLKIGKSESQVQRLITMFRKDEVIFYRSWHDENMTLHSEYKINEAMIDAHQRPSQKPDVKRPPRTKEPRKPNVGSFSATNQPKMSAKKRAIMEEDDE